MLDRLRAKESEAGLKPDPAIDAYLKATSVEGKRQNAVTNFFTRVLGLEVLLSRARPPQTYSPEAKPWPALSYGLGMGALLTYTCSPKTSETVSCGCNAL